ncbi:conserved hypothetical protein [Microsporum canis CBS 113480]|uniref:Uncharacterized protein n=1 Tax=Arthroderma otae (strain ATCC MYA-4605 / CBS 113480) TaxID=554155 RepID=C5FUC3_ARTOC|nr:conserved hypothetical protein [Microsporum canis CBS 113480]EEQ33507.1 conserved hypothetical protein [Microsporum canis CBS 113480]
MLVKSSKPTTKILSCLGHGLACLLSAPILDLCEQAKAQNGLLSDSAYSNHVVRISDTIAVKYGYGFPRARLRLNATLISISITFMAERLSIMEYIPGKSLEDLDLLPDDISERLAAIVSELASVREGTVPGRVDGGTLQGYLWGDNGTATKTHQQRDRPASVSFVFRSCCFLCMNDNSGYGENLYNAIIKIAKLAQDEQECVRVLLKARAASLRYIFEPLGKAFRTDIDSLPLCHLSHLRNPDCARNQKIHRVACQTTKKRYYLMWPNIVLHEGPTQLRKAFTPYFTITVLSFIEPGPVDSLIL